MAVMGTAVYGAVNESFTGIENLTGSANDDILSATGDAVNVFAGGAGNDSIDGGDGLDTATFADLAADITAVDNGDGTITVTTLTEGVDTLTNIETLLDGLSG